MYKCVLTHDPWCNRGTIKLTYVQSFSPVRYTVFELQGLKLNNNNNNKTFSLRPPCEFCHISKLRHRYPVVVKDVDSHISFKASQHNTISLSLPPSLPPSLSHTHTHTHTPFTQVKKTPCDTHRKAVSSSPDCVCVCVLIN